MGRHDSCLFIQVTVQWLVSREGEGDRLTAYITGMEKTWKCSTTMLFTSSRNEMETTRRFWIQFRRWNPVPNVSTSCCLAVSSLSALMRLFSPASLRFLIHSLLLPVQPSSHMHRGMECSRKQEIIPLSSVASRFPSLLALLSIRRK